jgi:serine/threonine-protein kinase HipA
MTGPLAPEELRDVDRADVYKAGQRAGMLTREADDTVFTYDPAYEEGSSPSVAFTLPKRTGPFRATGGSVPPFFAGLLPEGVRLTAVTSATRTSEDDHYTLLLAIGQDTVGDVEVVPTSQARGATAVMFAEADIGKHDLQAIFRRVSTPAQATIDRVGLPGVQVKASASMMSTPRSTTRGPAILKLTPPGFAKLVENESFFLTMATATGMKVPEHRMVHDSNGLSGLLVARFDRVGGGNDVQRVAQEDACQVMGRYPAAKYRIKLEDAIQSLAEAVTIGGGSAALLTRQALELAAFSYLIGNGDMHGKNLSIRRNTAGLWELTPAYDLLSTQPYTSWKDPMALPMYGRANKLTRRWWLDAATRLGIPERALASRLDQIGSIGLDWAARVSEIGFDEKVTTRLAALITKRSGELLVASSDWPFDRVISGELPAKYLWGLWGGSGSNRLSTDKAITSPRTSNDDRVRVGRRASLIHRQIADAGHRLPIAPLVPVVP